MVNKFRLIIAGSRGFEDYDYLKAVCDEFLESFRSTHDIHVVSGMARGADRLGIQYANESGFAVDEYPADWDEYGRSAGYIRNCEMAENADALIAFWDGESRGTKHMINIANDKGLTVKVICYDQDRCHGNL